MNSSNVHFNATIGGVAFTFFPLLDWYQVLQTVILATIGAIVSLVVSIVIRKIVDR